MFSGKKVHELLTVEFYVLNNFDHVKNVWLHLSFVSSGHYKCQSDSMVQRRVYALEWRRFVEALMWVSSVAWRGAEMRYQKPNGCLTVVMDEAETGRSDETECSHLSIATVALVRLCSRCLGVLSGRLRWMAPYVSNTMSSAVNLSSVSLLFRPSWPDLHNICVRHSTVIGLSSNIRRGGSILTGDRRSVLAAYLLIRLSTPALPLLIIHDDVVVRCRRSSWRSARSGHTAKWGKL